MGEWPRRFDATQLRGSLSILAIAALVLVNAAVRADETRVLPIEVHVVHVDGAPVVARNFVEQRLERANAIFGAYGVRFAETGAPSGLPARHAALETRADRDALGAYARRGAIHCFVVRSLRDVDEPARMRRGVHWRSRTYPGAHFVVLSSIAGLDVLAHELGHYLGNPEHSDTPGNLMSYDRGAVPPFLDAGQLRRMRAAIRRYVSTGELPPQQRIAAVEPAQTQRDSHGPSDGP
jgi:hypothetical protein